MFVADWLGVRVPGRGWGSAKLWSRWEAGRLAAVGVQVAEEPGDGAGRDGPERVMTQRLLVSLRKDFK